MMNRNKIKQIKNQTDSTILAFTKSQYAESILASKRVLEQICTLLLRENNIIQETYNQKRNAHIEWNLEKKIKECENRDILDSDMCAELYLIKDWRNDLEHVSNELALKGFASLSIEIIRKLYKKSEGLLALEAILHWPDNLESSLGNMLPFSPEKISMKNGQLVVNGEGGQRVCLDFINDGASWIDENGNKKFYKGNISERNNGKDWIG